MICCACCSVHCGMFSSIPDLHPLDANNIPPPTLPPPGVTNKKYLQTCPNRLWLKHTPLDNMEDQNVYLMCQHQNIDGSLHLQQLDTRVSDAFGLPENRIWGWHTGGLWGSVPRNISEEGWETLEWAKGEAELWDTWNRGPTGSCRVPQPCGIVPIEAKEQVSPTERPLWATPSSITVDEAAFCREKAIHRGPNHDLPTATTPGGHEWAQVLGAKPLLLVRHPVVTELGLRYQQKICDSGTGC